jgi:DNA primase
MFDISDFMYRNFDVHETDNDLHVCCPFCDFDDKYHLSVCKKKHVSHCYKCGYKASWITLVMNVLHCSYIVAMSELYVKPTLNNGHSKRVIDDKGINSSLGLQSLPSDFKSLYNGRTGEFARKYLEKRGFFSEIWKKYNLGVCESTHPYRVVIPIEDGYYQARATLKWMDPKYINPKSNARNYLFNSVALDNYDEVVICEGAFSAMAVGDNAIALIGKEPVREKIERLVNSTVGTFCVALDHGAGYWSMKLSEALSRAGKMVIVWDFLDDRDPADGGEYKEYNYDLRNKVFLMMKQV